MIARSMARGLLMVAAVFVIVGGTAGLASAGGDASDDDGRLPPVGGALLEKSDPTGLLPVAGPEQPAVSGTVTAQATPTVVVTPNTDLVAEQEVSVAASGFSPDLSIVIGQCGPEVDSIADCDQDRAIFLKTDASGKASVKIKVIVGTVGPAAHPCDHKNSCVIAASEPTPDPSAQRALQKITFADPASSGGGAPAPSSSTTGSSSTTTPGDASAAASGTPSVGAGTGSSPSTVAFTGAYSDFLAAMGTSLLTLGLALVMLAKVSPQCGRHLAPAATTRRRHDGRRRRRAGRLAILAASAAALMTVGPSADAQSGPAIEVTPTSGIKAGDQITVNASGFSPDLSIVIAQCGPAVTDISDCDVPGAKFVKTDAAGNASATLAAIVGKVGENAHPCDAANQCLIIASEPTPDAAAQRAELLVSFAGTDTPATTEGAAAPAKGDSSSSNTGVIVGAVAVLLIGAVGAVLFMRRKSTAGP